MKAVMVLCFVALLGAGAVEARGSGGRHARRPAATHLDVGLPNALLGANSPLLIHLKDQGLWDKENGASLGRSRVSLLPSLLKSMMMSQYQDVEAPDFDYSSDPSPYTGMQSPQMMIRSLVDEEELPNLDDLEAMVNNDKVARELYASENTQDRAHFFFQLRDALKDLYSEENEVPDQGSKGSKSQAGRDGGLRFNLQDLVAQLKQKIPAGNKIDLGSGDVSEKEVLMNLVELVKEYVEEEVGAVADPQPVEETQVIKVVDSEDEANAKMLEELRKSNVTVQAVDNTGGIFFNLEDRQGDAEAATEE